MDRNKGVIAIVVSETYKTERKKMHKHVAWQLEKEWQMREKCKHNKLYSIIKREIKKNKKYEMGWIIIYF